MSKFSITRAYQELIGQLAQPDPDAAKAVDPTLDLTQQIQSALAAQWDEHVNAAPAETTADDLAQRLVYITDWLDFHDRAITLGVKSGVPSALAVQSCSVAVVNSKFSLESIEVMEKAMKDFEGLNFTGGEIKKQQ